MNKIYPLFLQDKDGVMLMVNSEAELNYFIEKIDVEDGEYKVWDLNGQRYDLVVTLDEKISAKCLSDENEIAVLIHALEDYFTMANGEKISIKVPLDISSLKEKFDKHSAV